MRRTVKTGTVRTSGWRGAGSLTRLFALVILLAAGDMAAAGERITVYRCVDAAGRVALQDQPCPPGEEAMRRAVRAESDSIAASAPPAATAPPMPPVGEDAAPPARLPPPELWRCVDFDGKERFADHDDRNGRYVPLWVLSSSGGVAGRAGRPLPGFIDARPGAGAGSLPGQARVYVEDQCTLLPPALACQHYREQRSAAERQLMASVGERRRQLQETSSRLLGILRASCP